MAAAAAVAASRWRSWKTEQLTASWRSDCQLAAAAQASDSTQALSSTMWPLASAQGMSTLGGMGPRSGSFQRRRASKPSNRPVARSTAGWKTSSGSPSRPSSGRGLMTPAGSTRSHK